MDRDELIRIATRLRRETRNPDVIALCDALLAPVQGAALRYVSKWRQANPQRYRDYQRTYMRGWRERQRQPETVVLSS